MPPREFADGQDWSRNGTWREHCRHAGAVLKPGVEQWLHVGDFVAASSGDVLDGYRQIPRFQHAIRYALEPAVALHENALSALVHHHLGDLRIDEEILNRSKEREDAVEAAHRPPRDT